MILNYKPNEHELQAYTDDIHAGAEAEYELAASDYIVIKIAEAIALGDIEEADRIRHEHAADLEKRKELRRLINEIKAKWEQ